MSIGVGTPPQITTRLDGWSRTAQKDLRGFDTTSPGDTSAADASADPSAREPSGVRQTGSAPVYRLDAQTCRALRDLTNPGTPSTTAPDGSGDAQTSNTTQSGNATGTTNGQGKRVGIDMIHVELPNGVIFEVEHVPSEGEDIDAAMQSLVKTAEELSKALSSYPGTGTAGKDTGTDDDQSVASSYARQLSAYRTQLALKDPMTTTTATA